jgi:hypothetical protein
MIDAVRRWQGRKQAVTQIQLLQIAREFGREGIDLERGYELVLSLINGVIPDEGWTVLPTVVDKIQNIEPVDPGISIDDLILQYVWTSRTGDDSDVLMMKERDRAVLSEDLQAENYAPHWEKEPEVMEYAATIKRMVKEAQPPERVEYNPRYLDLTEREIFHSRIDRARAANAAGTAQAKSMLTYMNSHRAEGKEPETDFSGFLPFPAVYAYDHTDLDNMPMDVAAVVMTDYQDLPEKWKFELDKHIAEISVMAGLLSEEN